MEINRKALRIKDQTVPQIPTRRIWCIGKPVKKFLVMHLIQRCQFYITHLTHNFTTLQVLLLRRVTIEMHCFSMVTRSVANTTFLLPLYFFLYSLVYFFWLTVVQSQYFANVDAIYHWLKRMSCLPWILFLLTELLVPLFIRFNVRGKHLDLTHHGSDGFHVRHALDELFFSRRSVRVIQEQTFNLLHR